MMYYTLIHVKNQNVDRVEYQWLELARKST
jgi:hypothetical protein